MAGQIAACPACHHGDNQEQHAMTTIQPPARTFEPMQREEFRRVIAALGLTQGAAAKFLGQSPRTGRRYAAAGPPQPAAMLLRLMLLDGVMPDDVTTATLAPFSEESPAT